MQYMGEDYLQALEVAENYNNFISDLIVSWLKDAVEIIDFGAGTGLLAKKVREKTGRQVRCVEPAENMKGYLEGTILDSLSEVQDNSIDLIYSSNVLEHIEDDAAIISDMARTLKVGGRVCLYLPAFACLFSRLDRRVGHYRRYDKHMLTQLFGNGAWRVLDIRYADSLGFFATVGYKFFGGILGEGFNIPTLRFYDSILFPVSRFFDKVICEKMFGKNIFVCAEKCI